MPEQKKRKTSEILSTVIVTFAVLALFAIFPLTLKRLKTDCEEE
jgi:hypothetical protein